MIVRRTAEWLDDRLDASGFARSALNKVFPDHWSFMIGEIALYCFVILIATGTFLSFFFQSDPTLRVYDGAYEPLRGVEVSGAYESVVRLSFEVRAGLVMRQIHHWAAIVFVGAIVLHLCRIFFTGAFRRPRELNWMIGVTLLLLALANGFTGYSLPDDLLSGTGLRIAYSLVLSVPFIGTWLASLFFGGEFPSPDILSRLLVLHIFVVPAIMATLIGAHLAILWRQKHTQFPGKDRTEDNVVGSHLWPTYAVKSVGLFLTIAAVLGLLGGLAQINPVWLWGPFDPSLETAPAQPDWYMGWLEGALRIFPAWEIRAAGHTIPNPFYPGVLLPGFTFAVLYLWPFLEARFSHDRAEHHLLDRPRDKPARTAFGAAALAFYGVLFFAGSNDVIARSLDLSVEAVTWTFRILVLALPLLVAAVVYRIASALKASGAPRLLNLTIRDLTARRNRTPKAEVR